MDFKGQPSFRGTKKHLENKEHQHQQQDQEQRPEDTIIQCRIMEDDEDLSVTSWKSSRTDVSRESSISSGPTPSPTTNCIEGSHKTHHPRNPEAQMEMDWTCAAYATNITAKSSPQMASRRPEKQRQAQGDLDEDSGERYEGAGMDLGLLEQMFYRQTTLVGSGGGFMDYAARRGLMMMLMILI